MRDLAFQATQQAGLRAKHIAPINALVDRICDSTKHLWAPYVAPMYGGVGARLLSILRDPGPKTDPDHGGSGFLCWENDDPSAERIADLFAEANIEAADVVPWNAYPWYINREPTSAELEDGVQPMVDLIDMLPRLRVVMLHGGSAKDGWQRLKRRCPSLVDDRGLVVIPTYHPSPQAFRHPDSEVRQARRRHLRDAFALAGELLVHDSAQRVGA